MKIEGHKVQHKIPVPSNYRSAAKYLRKAIVEKKCIKNELLNDKHFRVGRTIMHRLMVNMPQINAIMKHIDLATKEPKLNEWLARTLICELLFGSGKLVSNCLPVETIRRYETDIRAAFDETKADNPPITRFQDPRFVRIDTSVLNLEGAKRLMQEEGWYLVDEEFTSYQSYLDRVKKLGDYEYVVDYHFKDMLVFPNSAKRYWAQAEHLRSKFFLQNKACLVPTYLLNPPKKSVVLDMCAAPGLKTTHLATLMKQKGRLYAVEMDAERYSVLCKFVADFGVIKTIHEDCLTVCDEHVPGVQYVLVDPSCSGSGMLNRLDRPETVDTARLYKLAGLQYKLLTHAMNAYPNVQRIVYSTCSVHEEENEKVVQGVLRHNRHFKLLDARKELGKEWINVGNSEAYPGIGERCLYARTEVDLTIGMFVALFERCADCEENEIYATYESQLKSEFLAYQSPDRNVSHYDDAYNEPRRKYGFPEGPMRVKEETRKRINGAGEINEEAKSTTQNNEHYTSTDKSIPPLDDAYEQDALLDVPIKEESKQQKKKNNTGEVIEKKKSNIKEEANEDNTLRDDAYEKDTLLDVPIKEVGKQQMKKNDTGEVIEKKKSKIKEEANEDDTLRDDAYEKDALADVKEAGKQRKRKKDTGEVIEKKKSKIKEEENEDDTVAKDIAVENTLEADKSDVQVKKPRQKKKAAKMYDKVQQQTTSEEVVDHTVEVVLKKPHKKKDTGEVSEKKKSKIKEEVHEDDTTAKDIAVGNSLEDDKSDVQVKKAKQKKRAAKMIDEIPQHYLSEEVVNHTIENRLEKPHKKKKSKKQND